MNGQCLSQLQTEELKLLKVFIKLCDENNLTYFVAGGSFLGAVRHQGFIPWDDDIDVAMPRPDFEKFIEIAPSFLPDSTFLSTYKRGKEHATLVAQLFGKEKKFLLNNAAKKVPTAAWVDILAIDGAPGKGIKRKLFGIRYLYYRMLNQFAHFEEIVNLNKQRPWYENVAIKFAQVTQIERSLDPVKIGDRFHRLLKSNRYEDCDEVATFMGAAKMKEIVPKEYYGKGTVYKFEDIDVKCPDKLDYLVHFYGDYMTPPPENERNRHNVKIIGGGGIILALLSSSHLHTIPLKGGVLDAISES